MTLEQELEELEVMLGFEPLEHIAHPNPERKYPGFFARLKKRIVDFFFRKNKGEIRGEVYE